MMMTLVCSIVENAFPACFEIGAQAQEIVGRCQYGKAELVIQRTMGCRNERGRLRLEDLLLCQDSDGANVVMVKLKVGR